MAKDTSSTYFNPDISSVKESVAYKKEEEAKKRAQEEKLTRWQRVGRFFANGRTRFAIGTILLLAGVYLLIAFLSFVLGAGDADQNQEMYYSTVQNARQLGSIHNVVGAMGATLSETLVRQGFGLAAFIIVIWCVTLAVRFFKPGRKIFFFSFTLITIFSLFAMSLILGACFYYYSPFSFPIGGEFGKYANVFIVGLMGYPGLIGVNFVLGLIWVLLCYETLRAIYNSVKRRIPHRRHFNGDEVDDGHEKPVVTSNFPGDVVKTPDSPASPATPPAPPVNTAPFTPAAPASGPFVTLNDKKPKPKKSRGVPAVAHDSGSASGQGVKMANIPMADDGKSRGEENLNDPTGEYRHYFFPPLDLLADIKMKTDSVDVEEQEDNKRRITETLGNYGIQIKHIDVHVGPTVTLFEIVPEDGVRISKIRGLEDDIAMSLAALGIRIIAPMPGRGTIGIEVPNRDPQIVPIREVLGSKKFKETRAKLPMALGCTVSNEVFVADLAKMPHLLVAGATGKGKSVGLNTIIASLLYKKGPSELKLILIDPKRVEFSIYADLEKYYFARVPGEDRCIVTDTSKVVKTLNCLVQEMENRYMVLEEVGERKVEDYNKRWRNGLRNEVDADGNHRYRFMPYIVCIIDEFSDMIMTAGKEVETPIVRIAQKARAVGIHMIIATQRPSAKVITGLIKGNFPGRMAFAVSQNIDSRIILDRGGAEHLIGRGDMLFSVDGEITRLQCPFIDTPEITNICEYIKEQEDNDLDVNHEEPYVLPEYVASASEADGGEGGGSAASLNDRDPLFEEIARWVVQGDTASTSSVQRRYSIGYNRAGRIMDQLEAAGIVGPATGGKPRKVLLTPMDVDQTLFNSLH